LDVFRHLGQKLKNYFLAKSLPKTKQRTLAFGKKQRFFVLSFSELFVLPSFQHEGSKK
jgi:hypothetical protein